MRNLEIQYLIGRLKVLGVSRGVDGESLHDLNYQSLVRLLALKCVVTE